MLGAYFMAIALKQTKIVIPLVVENHRSTVLLRINLLLQWLCATKLINTIEEWLLAGGVDRRQHVTLAGPPGNRGEGVFSVLRTVCASLYTESAGGWGGRKCLGKAPKADRSGLKSLLCPFLAGWVEQFMWPHQYNGDSSTGLQRFNVTQNVNVLVNCSTIDSMKAGSRPSCSPLYSFCHLHASLVIGLWL